MVGLRDKISSKGVFIYILVKCMTVYLFIYFSFIIIFYLLFFLPFLALQLKGELIVQRILLFTNGIVENMRLTYFSFYFSFRDGNVCTHNIHLFHQIIFAFSTWEKEYTKLFIDVYHINLNQSCILLFRFIMLTRYNGICISIKMKICL